ncbi:MAG: hypothetical protein DLM65_08505 [Candidatus Aeolococcus gillhamiae]|uniref:Uncharacterized protein n=1 Tax=Candidatus Aeolococcus gillhamiae TaxID=3127015 RepID=A0A2W5Z4Z6_9BACT|nr:MAG: hypothetical protein DLM65_08505 [Candidatus Dormibacter sp. RRmetagenome_bin12]
MASRKRGREEQVSADTIREARDALHRLLHRVSEGTMTAPPGLVARLEGAIAALDAVLAEPAPNNGRPAAP